MENRLFEAEEHAQLYQRYRLGYDGTGIDQEIMSFLRQKLPKEENSIAVDVACGTGFLSRILAPHFDRVIGVDCSHAQIKVANENTSSQNIEYRVAFAEDLNFVSDASVDVVTNGLGIHYMDIDKFFNEVDRILKPGGLLVLIVYDFTSGPGGAVQLKLTPTDETDEEVVNGCQVIMDELVGNMTGILPIVRKAIEVGFYPSPETYEHHRVILPSERTCNINTFIGFVSALGTIRSYSKAHPEAGDIRDVCRKRLLTLLSKVSSSPEDVSLRLSTEFQCNMYRKPLLPEEGTTTL